METKQAFCKFCEGFTTFFYRHAAKRYGPLKHFYCGRCGNKEGKSEKK